MAKQASKPAKKKTPVKAKKSTTSKAAIDPLKHFAYLASSSDEALLKLIFESATATEQKGVFTVELKNGFTLQATPPAKKIPSKSPKTFNAVLKKHASLTLMKGKNIILQLGVTGIFDTETLEDNESPVLDFVKNPKDLIFPLSERQDCWVYNPAEKNDSKEPVIYFLSHETLDPSRPQECNIGSLFLQRCSQLMSVTSIKQEKSKNGPLELEATKNKFFTNSRCVRLADGRVLKIGDKVISWLYFENGKFSEGPTSKFPLEPITPDYEIKCLTERTVTAIAVDLDGIFLFDTSSDVPKYMSTLVKKFDRGATILIQNHLVLYEDGFEDKPSAFTIVPYGSGGDITVMETDERLRLNSAVNDGNRLIFAGQDHILGFEFVAKTRNLTQVFKLRAEFGSPSIQLTPEKNYFVIFDEDEYAISLYHIDSKPKLIKNLLPESSARGWCWIEKELYVLIQNSKDGYAIAKYLMQHGELKSLNIVNIILKNSQTKWICITSFHVHDGTAFIINADGMTWELPVD